MCGTLKKPLWDQGVVECMCYHSVILIDPCLEVDLKETQVLETGIMLSWNLGGHMWHLWSDLMALEVRNICY